MDNDDADNINKTPPLINYSRKVSFDSEDIKSKYKWKASPKLSRKRKNSYFLTPFPTRAEKIHRAKAFGLPTSLYKSFELNQSFPRISRSIRRYDISFSIPVIKLKYDKMDKIRVDGSNGLRFSLRRVKGCFTPGSGSPFGAASTPLISTSAASDSLSRVPKSGINPNKAVFTIDSKTGQILIVNNNACQLLGYSSKELCSMQFTDLLTNKNKSYVCALAEGQVNSEDGTMVLLSGKVVEMTTKTNDKVAVSLWIRQIDNDGRCLAFAEPVERRICQFVIDHNGIIMNADYECLMLFQFESIDHLIGMEISTLIPAIILPSDDCSANNIPKNIRKQKATGKTADGISFPLCLLISHQSENSTMGTSTSVTNDNSTTSVGVVGMITQQTTTTTTTTQSTTTTTDTIGLPSTASPSPSTANLNNSNSCNNIVNNNLYVITVWVFQNLSGLLVLDEYGFIETCNHHFSMLMFGYAQNKIINYHISKLIPNFGQELEFLGVSRSRNATESSLDNEDSETETDPVYIVDQPSQQQVTSNILSSSTVAAAATTTETSAMTVYTQNLSSSSLQNNENIGSSLLNNKSNIVDAITTITMTTTTTTTTTSSLSSSTTTTTAIMNNKKEIYHHLPPTFQENSENDKNIPNLKSVNDKRNSMQINADSCDADFNLSLSNNDNDLLTPVNDDSMNESYSSITNNINDSISITTRSDNPLEISSATSLLLRSTSINSSSGNGGMSNTEMINKSKNDNFSTTTTVTTSTGPQLLTSTPGPDIRKNSLANIVPRTIQCPDGKYKSEAIHSDGNVIDILYTVSKQILPCGRQIYCVWICRDPDTVYDDDNVGDGDGGNNGGSRYQNLTLTFNSITSTIEHSLGQTIKQTAAQNSSSRPNSVSLVSQCEDEQISGEFSKHYTTLKQIGKGAYGYVKMAYRNSDRLLVVAKFILKEKLCPQFMITTDDKKEIPMEIYLLTTVKHPNIVTVYDVFENEKFFQLVMEKHGSGMDLFEFIDRRPLIDEKLGCFIFKQIANAVNYLHSLNILHRDIKDENIIIDQNFHIKLIDFGSATFMEEGKLFSTFFGTTEYCSPEVLAGNKYAGPELEMWSLGVTLYVLMFYENPFLDVEETLRADLIIPHKVSSNLENLLLSMLDKDPKTRCTMRQLMSHPWINQDINPSIFNFAWIVPCEPYEANPEKYYTGHIYSSTTALSTTSPQDSLSLVDEDSIIDGDEVDDGDNDDDNEEKISLQSQQARICDNSDKSLSVQSIEELTSHIVQSSISDTQHNMQNLSMTDSPIKGKEIENINSSVAVSTTTSGKAVEEGGEQITTIPMKLKNHKMKMMMLRMKPNSSGSDTLTNDDDDDVDDYVCNDDEKKPNASYKILSVEYNNDDSTLTKTTTMTTTTELTSSNDYEFDEYFDDFEDEDRDDSYS